MPRTGSALPMASRPGMGIRTPMGPILPRTVRPLGGIPWIGTPYWEIRSTNRYNRDNVCPCLGPVPHPGKRFPPLGRLPAPRWKCHGFHGIGRCGPFRAPTVLVGPFWMGPPKPVPGFPNRVQAPLIFLPGPMAMVAFSMNFRTVPAERALLVGIRAPSGQAQGFGGRL